MNEQLYTLFLNHAAISLKHLTELCAQADAPIEETCYLALGGGLGSFVWVDHLRIYGVPAKDIIAVGVSHQPHGRYRQLCQNSQIPDHERLRSDSGSTPDCLWGWPGYAVREIGQELKQGHIRQAGKLAWQIFSESALSVVYTPKAGDVYGAIEQESKRIGWNQIWRYGRIRCIRKTDDGRYVVLCQDDRGREAVYIGQYLHMALGYPGVRFLPDLQQYRQQTGDFKRVVNAYESHEALYTRLGQEGGTVLLRGRGIVASRILQRLHEVQMANPSMAIHVIHLMRSPQRDQTRYERAHRTTEHHWQLQPYNFPKACFTGDLRVRFESLAPEERGSMVQTWAGTTTADRVDWRNIVHEGLNSGWYQIRFGDVTKIKRQATGKLSIEITIRSPLVETSNLPVDAIIDCTGLASNFKESPLLCDLHTQYGLTRNPLGNLDVTTDFEVDALRNAKGRVFAAGAMTLGGPFGPVDSFLGLQYAAYRSVEALVKARAPGLRSFTMVRSLGQWLRWARKETP
ncbi:MAG: hypothetical protein AAF702_11065 [Chloroflexota bacterium]